MKFRVWIAAISLFALLASTGARAGAAEKPVALFYLGENPDSIRSYFAHSAKIGLLVPTWYEVNEDGLVSGGPNPMVLENAHKQKLPVMPLIALFNKDNFHKLATNNSAQELLNAAMIRECKLHGYTGFQFDFENIRWTDKDNLTALVKKSAEAMHKAGLQLTIATVPNAPGYVQGKGGFGKWIFTDWRGAYDIAEIGKYVDLVCLMTYDQQTRWTMPGPVAGWGWTVENLQYALKVVPREKLSLGIPLYGYHWFTGAPNEDKTTGEEKPNPSADYINALDAVQLADAYNGGKIEWDTEDHSAYFYFYREQMREWVYYTDLHTFKDRYELMESNGLQGFCSWVLGAEDPEIWTYLPDRK
jgi:spore germination protein YaaH